MSLIDAERAWIDRSLLYLRDVVWIDELEDYLQHVKQEMQHGDQT